MKNILIIFGRYPEPGTTKTRLIPALGPAGAADFQRRLTEKTVSVALKAAWQAQADIFFVYSGNKHNHLKKWLCSRVPGAGSISFFPQEGNDLGERMKNAFSLAYANNAEKAVLFGTDIPNLTERHLKASLTALDSADLVIGPSEDGGYWLIAMKKPEDVFSSIPWSTPDVFRLTKKKADRKNLSIICIDKLHDIDTPEDIDNMQFKWLQPGQAPYLSVIIPVLNESQTIEKVIASAKSPDSEIIVVDGGSADKTAEIARKAGVTVIPSSKGRAVQQNTGAAAAKGKVLLFLHGDTFLPDNYVHFIFTALMDAEILGGAFLFKTDAGSLFYGKQHRIKRNFMAFIEKGVNMRTRCLNLPYGDQGIFVRKETFHKLGGFPLSPIAEDLFFIKKLCRMGNLSILPAYAVTSARRWSNIGILRTTIINAVIATGCYFGIPPDKLAPLYQAKRKTRP